ncbi:hypothetical protein E3O19_10130 [Cryobacterium algoritolerans]|uniref:Mycothiol biosynthesis protein n=1 Tax=Cryobacterium algoritolerans TaxID=1259184 RepID=A0A4R8WVR4_9MICO|nr:hypothetical protein [Cryobacterium algoritolerans]TFC14553.1 hypothetical protein E3O19_10130 [Cryobacterium algoritolerans]
MVMSGSGESVVFVHDRPGDEALLTGGTIARLRADGADVVVLFGARTHGDTGDDTADSVDVRAAMSGLGVSDWRMLPAPVAGAAAGVAADAATDRHALAAQVADVLLEVGATALVLGTDDSRLQTAATVAAHAAGIPVFQSKRVSGAIGQRLIAIDVSDQVERKLAAVAAYSGRWSVADHTVVPAMPPGGIPTGTVVGGTETFVRLPPPPAQHAAEVPPVPGGRALAGLLAFMVGAAFGVLGTIAHQATIVLGPVTIPIGLVLALAGVTALLAGLRLVVGDRLVVLLAAIGLLGTIFLLSLRSEGGSVLVPEGLPGTLWTVGPTLVATIVLAWPRIPGRRGTT